MGHIEEIRKKNKLLAMIIRNDYVCEGVDFITPNEFSQQLAYMHHPAGKKIAAHVHNLVHRNVVMTQEVLFIKKGVLREIFMMSMKITWKAGICMQGISYCLFPVGMGLRYWKKWR